MKSLGCFGIFCVVCLLACTVVEVGALLWLDPVWLDRVAFWRPAPFPPDATELSDADAEALIAADLDRLAETRPTATIRVFEEAGARTAYEPSRGAVLESGDGVRVRAPAGAIGEALDIAIAPIVSAPAEMNATFYGPVYDLRIGAYEHYEFDRDVEIEIPYLADPPSDATVAVWGDGRWTPVPTRIDAASRRAIGRLPHASPVGFLAVPSAAAVATTGAATVAVVFPTIGTATGRGALLAAWYARSDELETNDGLFKIHYYRSGPDAVPADGAWPAATTGSNYPGHPQYVRDMAILLEESQVRMKNRGIGLTAGLALRHDVYLMNITDSGYTLLGGPIIISTDMAGAAREGAVDVHRLLRSVIAHEMFHVVQDDYFNFANAQVWRWWIECTGEYMGNALWDGSNSPTNTCRDGLLLPSRGALLRTPMDLSVANDYYAFAAFFLWLDDKYNGAGFNVIADVNHNATAMTSARLADIDAACRNRAGRGLAELFEEFALDYHHRDLPRATLAPKIHRLVPGDQAFKQSSVVFDAPGSQEWVFLKLNAGGGGGVRTNAYASMSTPPLRHLSAQALYFVLDHLPEDRKGKAVIEIEGAPAQDAVAYVGADRYGTATLRAVEPNGMHVVDGLSAPEGNNRATVILVNRSLSGDGGPVKVTRWLLLAPAWVGAPQRGAENRSRWSVAWHESELKKTPAFKRYKVYMRKPGESAWTPVTDADGDETDERALVDAPDSNDYVFTASVEDVRGNESGKAPLDAEDPFQGTWDGHLTLVEGSAVEPVMKGLNEWAAEDDAKSAADIAATEDAGERARMQRSHDEWIKTRTELLQLVNDVLSKFEQILRAGMPVNLSIRRTEGKYFLGIPEVCFMQTGMTEADEGELLRTNARTLAPKAQPKELPPIELKLHRDGEIRGGIRMSGKEVGDQTVEFKWTFKRAE